MDKSPMRHAVEAIGLVVVVALVNIGLYILIDFLQSHSYINNSPVFLALILFLSFAISIGIILVTALGEKINAAAADNPWIKKIGVTPIMIVVAAVIAMLSGFSALAPLVFPANDNNGKLKFMLADIGVRCLAHNLNKSQQATNLLAMIYSENTEYIKEITKFVHTQNNISIARQHELKPVLHQQGDKLYDLLWSYAASKDMGAEVLKEELGDDEKWVSYGVDVKEPASNTSIPIPTMYDHDHRTRLFVVLTGLPSGSEPEMASVNAGPGPITAEHWLLPLFQVSIKAKQPRDDPQLTSFDIQMFANAICWHIGKVGGKPS